jgi:hypothetical protein
VEAAVDRSDASALADLQMHWDEAYTIGLDGDIWLARFHGSADELRAHTSTELRELIRADYAYRQHAHRFRVADDGAQVASAQLAEERLDDDYGAHFDGTYTDGAEAASTQRGHEPGGQAGSSRAALPRVSYGNIRGERMST